LWDLQRGYKALDYLDDEGKVQVLDQVPTKGDKDGLARYMYNILIYLDIQDVSGKWAGSA
jgi:hypothetical protein